MFFKFIIIPSYLSFFLFTLTRVSNFENKKDAISEGLCKEIYDIYRNEFEKDKKIYTHTCKNGIVQALAPVYIGNTHAGNIIFGQLFFEEPDINILKHIAKEYGFSEEKYIATLKKVPIINIEKFQTYTDLFVSLANILSTLMNNNYKE